MSRRSHCDFEVVLEDPKLGFVVKSCEARKTLEVSRSEKPPKTSLKSSTEEAILVLDSVFKALKALTGIKIESIESFELIKEGLVIQYNKNILRFLGGGSVFAWFLTKDLKPGLGILEVADRTRMPTFEDFSKDLSFWINRTAFSEAELRFEEKKETESGEVSWIQSECPAHFYLA